MIDLSTKIHDRFTLEFKVGFNTEKADKQKKASDFVMNTWIFVPNSLDINPTKYSKENFYRDLKSDQRIITPNYTLHDLANNDQLLPNQTLDNEFGDLSIAPDDTIDLVHALKMYCAIAKSAFRDASKQATETDNAKQRIENCELYLADAKQVLNRFRTLYKKLKNNGIKGKIVQDFAYADEFLGNIMAVHTYRLRDKIHDSFPDDYSQLESRFKDLLLGERAYKSEQGYLNVNPDAPNGNEDFVFRTSLLKKFAESDLYLSSNKRKNTFLVEQILYSLAAGSAMLVATLSSFFFQQRYGNFTLPFLIALVVSYMFKDRLKEWLRLIFAKRLSSTVFDTRTDFRIKGRHVGWSKDSMDFIDSDKVLPEVMRLRDRLPLFDEVSGCDEKVILFRKKVRVWPSELAKASPFPMSGINDILRYNITELTRKMDNPSLSLSGSWEDEGYKPIEGRKIYRLTFVFQCIYDGSTEYKRVTVKCDKNGLMAVRIGLD